MTDLELSDLADNNDTDTGDDSGGNEGLSRIADYMIENGYLDAMMAEQFGANMTQQPSNPGGGGDSSDDSGGDLDSEAVAKFGKQVIDQVGDVPMSTVVQFAENNPEQVDALIEQVVENE